MHQMQFPPETAGAVMAASVPTALGTEAISAVRDRVLQTMHEYESVHYIYILDHQHKLLGALSLRELFRPTQKRLMAECLSQGHTYVVKPGIDQEHVVYEALKHGIKAVPVVDHEHRFLGAVTGDRILHILFHEAHDDLMRFAGIQHRHEPFDNVLTLSLWQSLRHRLPWLVLGLFGGLLTAKVVGIFEHTLEKNIILAAFIPLIVYMGDAVGTQIEAYMIRDVALQHDLPIVKYFLRQCAVVFMLATIMSALLLMSLFFLNGDLHLAAVIATSLGAAVLSSVCTGMLIPYGFMHLNMDPANASGPIATLVQDFLSIIVYFSIASVFL